MLQMMPPRLAGAKRGEHLVVNVIPSWVAEIIVRASDSRFSGSIELHLKHGRILGVKEIRVIHGSDQHGEADRNKTDDLKRC